MTDFSTCEIKYSVDKASLIDVHQHLQECSPQFVPALHNRVNLFSYSEKIRENACTLEAWCGHELVGLVAIYLNDETNKVGFITNVSTFKELKGRGVGQELMKAAIMYAKARTFKSIVLEVDNENQSAIRFYAKFNFQQVDRKLNMIKMQLIL